MYVSVCACVSFPAPTTPPVVRIPTDDTAVELTTSCLGPTSLAGAGGHLLQVGRGLRQRMPVPLSREDLQWQGLH